MILACTQTINDVSEHTGYRVIKFFFPLSSISCIKEVNQEVNIISDGKMYSVDQPISNILEQLNRTDLS